MSNDPIDEDAIDALAIAYSDAGTARLLVERAGFPPGRIPAFSTAMVFWHKVATDANNGLLRGGLRPILERAAKEFPGNSTFAPYAPASSPASSSPAAASTPAATPKPAGPIRIFISYSHKDEAYRETLETRLKVIGRLIPLDIWHDRRMLAGTKLAEKILEQLTLADVVLLLISPDFMASDYCFSKEMEEALRNYELNQGLPVPIIVRPDATWHLHQIGQHLALPRDGKAISKWPDADDAWHDVSEGLRRLLADLAQQRALPPTP